MRNKLKFKSGHYPGTGPKVQKTGWLVEIFSILTESKFMLLMVVGVIAVVWIIISTFYGMKSIGQSNTVNQSAVRVAPSNSTPTVPADKK